MAASARFKLKQAPLDPWSVKERLALASSVLRSGDQNWVSVSRAIKPYGEPDRPAEWFGQKNCALQYSDLLEKVETPKRKRERGEGTGAIETPGIQIVRKLTIERIEELKQIVQEEQEKYRKIKEEIELIRSGQWDDKVKDIWAEIQKEQLPIEVKIEDSSKPVPPSGTPKKKPLIKLKIPPPGGVEFGELPSEDSTVEKSEEDSNLSQSSVSTNPQSVHDLKPTPPPSPSLQTTSLQDSLKSLGSIPGQVQIKQEPPDDLEKGNDEANIEVDDIPLETIKQEDGTSKHLSLNPSGTVSSSPDTKQGIRLTPSHGGKVSPVKSEKLTTAAEQLKEEEAAEDSKDEDEEKIIDVEGNEEETLEDAASQLTSGTQKTPPTHTGGKALPVVVVVDDDNPLSPASSVVSNDTDIGISLPSRGRRRDRRRGRGSRRSSRLTRGKNDFDGKTDTSDDETELESDVASSVATKHSLAVLESVPNSPASLSQCSDTEDDKSFKLWKKSIMLVWRATANHKYANVFLHKVTNDIAPGYLDIVHRPMELQTIKRNIESGVIRTTAEFQRDMMLMFSNAIMYNNSDHRVYKMAQEMYNDVMANIEQFVNTQMMVNSEPKVLRASRRSDLVTKPDGTPDKATLGKDGASDKEDEIKIKRRPSTEQQEHSGGGKAKKRKTRADD